MPPEMSKPRKQSIQPQANQRTTPLPITQPTDAYIPPFLVEQVPELKSYKQLLEAESKIDIYISRKKIDLYQSVSQWNSLKQEAQEKQYLRIFVSNIAENQAWQTNDANAQPSWTLRIEGRLLNDLDVNDPQRPKFSSFLQGIAVDFTRPQNADAGAQDQQQPQPQAPSIVEWHADPSALAEFDGLDVKRDGAENVKCRIAIQPRGVTGEWIQFSPELSSIIGMSRGTLHEAVYSLYKYILINDLLTSEDDVQAPGNPSSNSTNGERTITKIDKYLAALFPDERKTMRLAEIPSLVNRHISPLPPIRIDYTIRVDKASTYGETVIDIEVPAVSEDEVAREGMSLLTELNQLSTTLEPQMQALNQELNILQLQLNASANKYQFFSKLSKDPVPMLQEYMDSSSRALKVLSGDDGFNEDTVRRAQFYKDNEAMLFENLSVLLSNGRM